MIFHKSYLKIKKLNIFKGVKDFKTLEKRIEKIDTVNANSLKGDIFEIFIQGLIVNDNNFGAKTVYPSLKQTPIKFRNKINIKTTQDKGIDGIIVTNANEVIPYQVKFRSFREAAEYGDTIKLEKQGKYADTRYYFYNSKNLTKEYFDEEKKNIAIGPQYLEKLDDSFFYRFNIWFDKHITPNKGRIKIDKYQQITINKVLNEFKKEDRATIAMACGSGKTLVSFWITEALKPKFIVVFLPSKALLKQIREEWLSQDYTNGLLENISVFSEKEYTEYDEQSLGITDTTFRVLNSKEKIKKFLRQKSNNTKVVFCTYQSSPLLSKSLPSNFSFDFGVFDEAHKTTSNKILKNKSKQKFSWNMPLQDSFIKIKKRLFMTATLKTSNYSKQNKLGYEQIVYSMTNEKQYGKIVDNFTFVKARRAKVICPIKVVVSIVTNDELHFKNISKTAVNIENQSVKTEQVAHQIAIKNAVEKFNTKKLFTYHSRCEDAESFTSPKPEGIKTHLPNFKCGYVDGSMKLDQRDNVMQIFKEANRGIVSNARCLIEGVNIPAVDMVSFVSPKKSAVDIVQAAGRAMRIRNIKNKKFGYILLPIFVERFRGEKIRKAINRTEFDVVLKFLKALSDYDESIKEEISSIVIKNFRDKGRKQKISKRQKEKEDSQIEFIGRSFEIKEIESSINLKIVNFFGTSFEKYLGQLQNFKIKHGHTNVPDNLEYKKLANWTYQLKLAHRSNKLDEFRIKQLNKIQFNWKFEGETLDNVDDLLWEKEIRRKYGITQITDYREKKIITPDGFYKGKNSKGVMPYYSEKNITSFLKKNSVNLKLEDVKDLFTLKGLSTKLNLPENLIGNLYEEKKIVSVGNFFTNAKKKDADTEATVGPFFKNIALKEILRLVGATGLFTSKYTVASKLSRKKGFSALRKNNHRDKYNVFQLLKKGEVVTCIKNIDIPKIKKIIWGDDSDISNLISEPDLAKLLKNSGINQYRKKNIIKPVLFKKEKTNTTAYYSKDVVDQYYKYRGITVRDTTGLFSESEVERKSGFGSLNKLRNKGKIKSIGIGVNKNNLAHYYNNKIFKELQKIYPDNIKRIKENMITTNSEFVVKNNLKKKINRFVRDKKLKPIGRFYSGKESYKLNVFYKKDLMKLIKNS